MSRAIVTDWTLVEFVSLGDIIRVYYSKIAALRAL